MAISQSKRENVFDFLRSIFMLVVFFAHFYFSLPNNVNFLLGFVPFAELFVVLAGFMVGFIYLYRSHDFKLMKRGINILLVYYIVALPIGVVGASFGGKNYSITDGIIDTLTLHLDMTFIGILRFYGIIFICLPIILKLFRKSSVTTIIASIILFFSSSIAQQIFKFEDLFVTNVLISTFQWQLFFVIGLTFGDLYKRKKLNIRKLILSSFSIGAIAFVVQMIWFREIPVIKFPYSYAKLLNTLYLSPIYLYLLIRLYKKIEGGKTDRFVRVVGRNSLIAFVFSEIIRYYFVWGGSKILNLHLNVAIDIIFAVVLSVLLILLLWVYEKSKQKYFDKKREQKLAEARQYVNKDATMI